MAETDKKIDTEFCVKILVEILFERGLLNRLTFEEIQKRLQIEETHNSQEMIA